MGHPTKTHLADLNTGHYMEGAERIILAVTSVSGYDGRVVRCPVRRLALLFVILFVSSSRNLIQAQTTQAQAAQPQAAQGQTQAHKQPEGPPLAPGAEAKGPQQPVQQYYAQDGGTREVLESIVIPPKTKAPFTMMLQTEWVRALSDGGTITTGNKRRVARDSQGRIYQERWFIVPKNGKAESEMTTIQISDPNKHTHINCFVWDGDRKCVMGTYTPAPDTVYTFQGPATGPLPDDMGSVIHEDLGTQIISGIETKGTRDTTIYNPWAFGNDRKMTIEREFWYSPELGLNLLSKRSDPRIGKQTFTAISVIQAEPDAKLFEIPEGYTVEDRRASAKPEN